MTLGPGYSQQMAFIDTILARLSGVSPARTQQQIELVDAGDSDLPPLPVVETPALPSVPQPVAIQSKAVKAKPSTYLYDRRAPLLRLSRHDYWTVEDATAGCHVYGGNGSGKSSTSGQAIAKAFLRANFGGLVLCAKPDEAENWKRYAKECGRSDQLIIVSDDDSHGHWRFNFIQYELNRPGDPASRVDNLVTVLMNLLEQTGRQSGGDDRIWQQAAEQLLRNVLMILITARREFSLLDVQKFIDAIPQSLQAAATDSWKHSDTARYLDEARAAYEHADRLADYHAIHHYITVQFPSLADRTRSSVTFTLSAMLQDLLVGTTRELLASGSNFFPEDSHEGAVIILALPAAIKRGYATAQTLFKVVWQMAALRRMEHVTETTRPIFLFMDESHIFASDFDTTYQSLARASKACTCALTQNLSSYFQRLGGSNPEHTTRALMGFYQTHLFHAQSDPATIDHAQKLFGRAPVTRINEQQSATTGANWSYTEGQSRSHNNYMDSNGKWGTSGSGGWNTSDSYSTNQSDTKGISTSTTMEEILQASDFTGLATGSDQVDQSRKHLRGVAQAWVFRTGRPWANGQMHLLAQFNRRLP